MEGLHEQFNQLRSYDGTKTRHHQIDNDKAASDTVIIQRKMTEYRPYLNWWAKKQLMVSESRVIL